MSLSVVFNSASSMNVSSENQALLVSYAIKNIVDNASGSYYHSEEIKETFGWIFSESNFDSIWNDYPSLRVSLINLMSNSLVASGYREGLYTADFSRLKLEALNSMLLNEVDDTSDSIRRSIVPTIYPDFDYKSEIIRLLELERSQHVVNSWIDLASTNSKSEDLFEFLLSNIKRAEGSTELKVKILDRAFSNGVVCEAAIKKIAASSPVSLKRTVVDGLVRAISDTNYMLRYPYHRTDNPLSADDISKKRDRLENLVMLFAGQGDRQILRNLASTLSIQNLPWILPAASEFPWIVKEIQRRIDRGE